MNLVPYLLSIAIGVVTGGLTSLIGASGVMVIVPVLTMFFKVSAHTAIGTSLFVDVLASATVSYTYLKNGNLDLKSGLWIAVASIAGAQLGALFASRIKEGPLSALFGVFLIFWGVVLMVKNYKKKADPDAPPTKLFHVRYRQEWQKVAMSIGIGIVIGVISGLFGAGGGVMILLTLIMVLSYPLHKAIGTSTLIMAMTALSSTVGYAYRGNIDLPLACFLSAGAIAGGLLGARYANKVNEATLGKVISICFTALGVVMTIIEIIELL